MRNPYWAAMPVWVIAQPARGVLLERAVFRVAGTLLGAAVGFGLLQLPLPPLALAGLLALWIALNAGAAHVLRGVHGYGALLAGMTAAIVVLPGLVAPAGALAIAEARVACTLIGVLVGSAVMAFQTPESPLAEFYDEVRAVSADAVSYAARTLRGGREDDGREERRILAAICHLDSSARTHAAGSVAGYRRLGDVDLLVVGSLTTMAAARSVRDAGCRFPAELPERLEAIAQHLRTAWTQPLGAGARPLPGGAEPNGKRLDAALGDLLAADLALARTDSPRAYAPEPRPAGLAPHREWTLAWREGTLAGVASFAALALALKAQAPAAGLAALGICIFVMVLGSMPLPQLVAPKLISGVALGVLAALGYRLLVQPALHGPAALLLSLVPFLVAGGLFRAHPRFGAAGLDFSMCFCLASQAGLPAVQDPARLCLEAGALLASAGTMAALFILLPPRAHRQAVDAATVIRRDLLRILATDTDPERWRARASRQILRLVLHLGRAKDLGRRQPRGLLAALNLGHGLIELKAEGLPESVRTLLAGTLQRRLPPGDAVKALQALAEAEPDTRLRERLQSLQKPLEQAGELLAF